jgi:hypothetical protein
MNKVFNLYKGSKYILMLPLFLLVISCNSKKADSEGATAAATTQTQETINQDGAVVNKIPTELEEKFKCVGHLKDIPAPTPRDFAHNLLRKITDCKLNGKEAQEYIEREENDPANDE